MGRKKPKALLAEQGIVHLKHSFVQPTEESGLLKTVGGEEERTALILATGTYGYAIPMSSLDKEGETEDVSDDDTQDGFEVMEETSDPDIKVVKQVIPERKSSSRNGSKSKKVSNSTSSSKDTKAGDESSKKEINPDELSVAELVRVIGGGSGAPLRHCDVVEDRQSKIQEQAEADRMEIEEAAIAATEDDPEADAFYESLGMPRSKKRKLDIDEPAPLQCEIDAPKETPANKDADVMQSIAEYYKDNVNQLYYYSQQHNPYDENRLEFGPFIDPEDSSEYDQDYIQLARLAQRARAAALAAAEKRKRELEKAEKIHEEAIYDPLPMEVVASTKPEDLGITVDTTLDQYWEFVKKDPHDFDRWIYLIQYAERKDNLNVCRSVYSAFLPLFPYCFGYWTRYSELEKKSLYFGRALAILEKGLEFIPLSIDLWLCYLSLFGEINAHLPDYEVKIRREYERALNTCGMEFRSDSLWENYMEWETVNKRLKRAFTLYRRLIQVPTRLYNRHWDNVQQLVRDHHPRDFLNYDEYETMRKKGCKKLGFRYKPEPDIELGELRKTSKPEDKLMDYTKTKVTKQLGNFHEKCEEQVNKRWGFEDKIRRPYFHTKPLDKFQLRNWEEYLNFEMQEKDHERIVLLFERCLIACSQYEEFWSKYARYVETYHKEHSKDMNVSVHVQKIKIDEELVSQKETEKEEAIIADVKDVLDGLIGTLCKAEEESKDVKETLESLIEKVILLEENEDFVFNKFSTASVGELCQQLGGVDHVKVGSVQESQNDNAVICQKPDLRAKACFRWQETVRDIYKRACIIHCAKKPIIRLQWAAFEEELGNVAESRKLIQHVLQWFPQFLDGKLQLLDLERRAGNAKVLEELYEKYIAAAKSPSESSLLAMKYARFLFKEQGKADKALTVLRKAIRKDKGNAAIYSYVFDICYERYPTDRKGAAAALEIAILSKDMSEENKLIFLRRKMLFFQEHGDLKRVRDAVDQLRSAEEKMRKVKAEEERKKVEEAKELELLRAQAFKQLQAAELHAYPVPDAGKPGEDPTQNPVPIEFENEEGSQNPIRAKIITQGSSLSSASDAIKEGPELPYQHVPPPQMDFIVDSSTYGYGSKHPDRKINENMAQKEYEKLEARGYPETLKDSEEDRKYLREQAKIRHSNKDPTFIVPPRESYSIVTIGGPPRRNTDQPEPGDLELKPPRVMAILPVPSTAPCVNVPDWFVKEGGELCLSESRLGFSILRYWPNFLEGEVHEKMFRNVRKHVKWHQKQKIIAGHWRYLHRLVSWLGPCDFTHNGMVLQKCEDWPPEILDKLHKINKMVNHEFNACSLDLYRHGHDWNTWHSDNLPAYGSNPPVAIVSLGNLRILEMKRKGPEFNYVRLPLYPGSLLLMEGVTQADWAHQITKDPMIKDETLLLSFRIMHAIEVPDPDKLIKFVKGNTGGNTVSPSKDAKDKDKSGIGPSQSSESPSSTNSVTIPMDAVKDSSRKPSSTADEQPFSTKIIFHKIR
ncbi:Pre-mRNA-processing factor 39 [Orchesella cincta]|uniref:Pre-mRNA-processing factor 39 n=1 Tax=Orchesella cincta TaxID=48709 RepID=A0A1D2MSD5_ORCCI|nr:Pre-mRNA-processing factor 39 [Orchesella cincta]